MEENEIVEGNKLTAEFMEAKQIVGDLYVLNPHPHKRYKGSSEVLVSNMEYHSSWDWLMPVVVKLNIELVPTDIKKAYEMVINFIQLKKVTN